VTTSIVVSPGTVDVVTLGECLVAMVASDPGPLAEARMFVAHVAGAEANLAVGLARLGMSSAIIGRVGDDGFGAMIMRRLRGEGVDVSGVSSDTNGPTGMLVRSQAGVGKAELRYYRAGSAGSMLSADDVTRHVVTIRAARILHVTGITPALSGECHRAVLDAVDVAKRSGRLVSMDINFRRRLWSEETARDVLMPIARSADILVGSPCKTSDRGSWSSRPATWVPSASMAKSRSSRPRQSRSDGSSTRSALAMLLRPASWRRS